jgi:hypothetical protein
MRRTSGELSNPPNSSTIPPFKTFSTVLALVATAIASGGTFHHKTRWFTQPSWWSAQT